VGVVLSGGGAKGMAHIGFLQELEDNGVPIDFIAGTSMGAMIAAHYAAGWSPEEMAEKVASPEFAREARGEAPWRFGYKQDLAQPDLVKVHLSADAGVDRSNLISGLPTDWMVFEALEPANAVASGDFDALFVPFRCVASEIRTKSSHTFRSGSLSEAVRASMTYPFYLPPVVVGDSIFLDGGLYNNFPSDVLYEEFMPDIIIGCRVSSEDPEDFTGNPSEVIEWMVTRPTDYSPLCPAMFVVAPDLRGMDTFDFDRAEAAIDWGAQAARQRLPEILETFELLGGSPTDPQDVSERRAQFRAQCPPFTIGATTVSGLTPAQSRYVTRLLNPRVIGGDPARLERNLYLLESDPHIGSVRPVGHFNPATGAYDVSVACEPERELLFRAGGSLSSRPVSFGHVGVGYGRFGRIPFSAEMSSSFGSFYSALHLTGRLDRHGLLPVALAPEFTLHRWNFVRSFATFFEDVRPSYLVLLEQSAGVRLLFPTGPTGEFSASWHQIHTVDNHYPSIDFNPADTTDLTRFDGYVAGLRWRRSDIDHPIFGRSGSNFSVRLHRFDGESEIRQRDESTGRPLADTVQTAMEWIRFQFDWEQYFGAAEGRLAFGLKGAFVVGDEPLRDNLRSAQIAAVPYSPLPGSRSRFLENYRSPAFLGAGMVFDLRLLGSLRWRTEAHWYRPFVRIAQGPLGPLWDWDPGPGYLFGSYLLADTQAGIFSLGAEHYWNEREPWLFELSWGKRIFAPTVRW
jgi:NTE family protein